MKEQRVRLLPALMVTMGLALSLKAVALAAESGEAKPAEGQPQASASKPKPAADSAEKAEGEASAMTEAGPTAPACPAPSFADQAGLSPAEVQVLQSLGERRRALDARAAAIQADGALLEAAQKRLDERVAEMKRIEDNVKRLLGQLDEAQAQRVDLLVQVYTRMRAKDAAAVFDGLDDDALLEIAGRMRQQNLAEIMAQMDPARARRLTRMLVDERRNPAAALAAEAITAGG